MLGHVAEAGPDPDRILRDVDPGDFDTTVGRMGEPEQKPERGGLAGAVRADEPNPAPRQLDAQVIERGRARIPLGDAIEKQKPVGAHDAGQFGSRRVQSTVGEIPEAASGCNRVTREIA